MKLEELKDRINCFVEIDDTCVQLGYDIGILIDESDNMRILYKDSDGNWGFNSNNKSYVNTIPQLQAQLLLIAKKLNI